jgi:hypothetical protein
MSDAETPKPPADSLTEKQTKQLVEIVETELHKTQIFVLEKQIQFLISIGKLVVSLGAILIAIFGLALPLWNSQQTTQKTDKTLKDVSENTDKAISDMQAKFKELAGTALRKPVLDCFVNHVKLDGQTLNLNPTTTCIIELHNSGDYPAKTIQVRLYTNLQLKIANPYGPLYGALFGWTQTPSEDSNYKFAYRLCYATSQNTIVGPLDPGDSDPLPLDVAPLESGSFPALIKIFYEQPEPRQIPFTMLSNWKPSN